MGEIVGYGRVSSLGQSLDIQEDKLKAAGCSKLFMEKRSGRQADNRPQLQECLAYLREGDQLVITKLDRMARSILDLVKIADLLNTKKVTLKVLDQSLDTRTAEGRLMFSLLSAFAEFENDIRRERQVDGIAKAQQKGIKFGRKVALNLEQQERVRFLREDEGFTVPQIAERFNVGVATVYRVLKAAQNDAAQLTIGAS